jgi:hypothetical protein
MMLRITLVLCLVAFGARAQIVAPGNYVEPGSTYTNASATALEINLSNIANNVKHGIEGTLVTTSSTGTINSNLIVLNIYTPPDNGGDVSGIYVSQTGGGNAASFFNTSANTPAGLTTYPNNGFAIEAQTDGNKTSVFSQTVNGKAFLAVAGTGNTAQGFVAEPSDATNDGRNAISVYDSTLKQNFYVDYNGQTFISSNATGSNNILTAIEPNIGNNDFLIFLIGKNATGLQGTMGELFYIPNATISQSTFTMTMPGNSTIIVRGDDALGFHGATPITQATPSGACAGNTGCQALRTALGNLGLINPSGISN